jgi:hypothetical protein
MQKVKMEKDELLTVVQKNRDQHRKEYVKAREGFRKKAIKNYEQFLDRAKKGGKIELYVGLVEPQDHTDDYDRVLEMLKYEVEEDVTLSATEFSNYVQDQWGWTENFKTTNASYGVRS